MYGDGKVNYENIELGAEIITMNMDSSTVYARGVIDSVGVEKGKPVFKDGETPYETKAIRYNFKSKKGFINNVVTQQGEGYVVGNNAKKGANDELFMENGRYTTCDHHDHPHFGACLSGSGRCTVAFGRTVFLLSVFQQLFFGLCHAELYG